MRVPAMCLVFAFTAVAGAAETRDVNAFLCEPDGWVYNRRYVSISRQAEHVHGEGTGLLFEYTRDSADLFDGKRTFQNAAYRPSARKELDGLSIAGYGRFSFWIYIEGNAEEAVQLGFGSQRPFRLSCRRGEWFHARWNLRDLPTDPATATFISFAGVNQGTAPGDSKRARVFLSDFRLEKGDAELRAGWAPDPAEIVLPYTGFAPEEEVTALVAAEHSGKLFSLGATGPVTTGRVSGPQRGARAEVAEVRLTAPRIPGDYRLQIEGGPGALLRVCDHPYGDAIRNALRAIRAQRCGCRSELHAACHLDDAVRADTGQVVDVSGGWHDEGVSQYTHLTARTTAGLARYWRSQRRHAKARGEAGQHGGNLLDEVTWGLRSVLKYDLGDGHHYHGLVAPYWYHTDNERGTGDERRVNVFHPHQLSCWWRAEALALAAGACGDPLRSQARELAESYWSAKDRVARVYTEEERRKWENDANNLRVTAARVMASLELFRLTGEQRFADDAATTAGHLLRFQEREAKGETALVGYFYKNLGQPSPYTGVNGKSLDVPGRALAELLLALPDHAQASQWRDALQLYADGTLKPLARLNAPFGCVGTGPYEKPVTALFPGEQRGDLLVYPFCIVGRTRQEQEIIRVSLARPQLGAAVQLAAAGRALSDPELVRMAHEAVRFLLGANPSHVSFMRHFGERWPEHAQLPNVPGMIVGWMGVTKDGLPFFDPRGAGRLEGPDRFVVKEGNTAMCAYLLDVCSYLEASAPD